MSIKIPPDESMSRLPVNSNSGDSRHDLKWSSGNTIPGRQTRLSKGGQILVEKTSCPSFPDWRPIDASRLSAPEPGASKPRPFAAKSRNDTAG
jgi:hypothetical protein